MKRILAIVVIMASLNTLQAQDYVGLDVGSGCAGETHVFYFTCAIDCSNFYWVASPGGQIESAQGMNHIQVVWNSPTNNAGVTVHYTTQSYPYEDEKSSEGIEVSYAGTPGVGLTSDVSAVCQGSDITFTASPTHGGSSPSYQWYVDGVNVSSGGLSQLNYSTASLSAGSHNAYVVMTTSAGCSTSPTATSSTINFTVNGRSSFTVDIEASTICSQENTVSFYAVPEGTYGNLTFQWYLRGSPVDSNSPDVFANRLTATVYDDDAVYCVVTSDGCVNSPVTSSIHTVDVSPAVTPTVNVYPPSSSYCPGEVITFAASASHSTSSSTYLWYFNGGLISAPSDAATINLTASTSPGPGHYTPGSTVSVTVNGLSGPCLTSTSATGNANPMDIKLVPNANADNQTICSGNMTSISITNPNGVSGTTYSWTASGTNVTGASDGTGPVIAQTLTSSDGVSHGTVVYTITPSSNGCAGTPITATATVSAVPNAEADDEILFSGNETSIVITNPNAISGTTFSWTASSSDTEGASSGSGAIIAQGLTSANGGTVTYTITPEANGCQGSEITVLATVYPRPIITSSDPRIVFGGTATMATDAGYDSYLWKKIEDEEVGDKQTVTVSSSGFYTVTVTKSGASGTSLPFEIGGQFFGQNANYIISYNVLDKDIKAETEFESLPTEKVGQVVQYFDGLGRHFQTVTTQGSPANYDMVQPVAYDQFGREAYKYLPYVSQQTDGWYKDDALSDPEDESTDPLLHYRSGEQHKFYQTAAKVARDLFPYAVTAFEPSPLNRVSEQGASGEAWQPNTGATIKKSYASNAVDEVLIWTYTTPTSGYPLGLVASPAGYVAGALFKNIVTDEDGSDVIEYTDKQGKIVLKRIQVVDDLLNGEAPPITDTNYASTYYIHDDFGNLVCVIQPEGVANIADYLNDDDDGKNAFLGRWAFRYRYDGRKRMIMKQVPGAEAVYMVYDNRDRLVLTQDGNQRVASLWSFTKYDHLNRPILTGIKDATPGLTQAGIQAAVDLHYAQAGAKWGETYSETGPIHGYSNETYPVFTSGSQADPNHYLTVTYYDNYDFRGAWIYEIDDYRYSDEGLSETVNGTVYAQPNVESSRVKGQVTGSKVKVLDGGARGGYTWLKSVNYYDEKYRLVQSVADNYKGGQDRTTSLYHFTGKVLETKIEHTTNEISWKELVNTVVAGNNLIKTKLGLGWNAGAVTVEQLAAGTDGWIECVISEPDMRRAFGLSEVNDGEDRNTIDYGFWHDGTQAVFYDNNGDYNLPNTVKSGDVIRIERSGTTMKYYVNGQLFHTTANASLTALIGDACIDTGSGNILLPRASFNFKANFVERRFVYDHAGRLTEGWHGVNGPPDLRIVYNQYNELGQLIDKKLHSVEALATDAHQSIDYRYNIRGWLTDMNEDDLTSGDSGDPADDYFSFQLIYNDEDIGIGNEGFFNGNISAMKWSTNLGLSEEKMNAYKYDYDNLNRIMGAEFKTATGFPQALSWSTPATNAFSASNYEYDLNGNILALTRKGKAESPMDILTYEYGEGDVRSNRLLTVTDTGSKTEGFTEQVSEGVDYEYDNNGNLVWDQNKGGEEILVNGDFTSGSIDWVVTDAAGRLTFPGNGLDIVPHATETATISQNDLILPHARYVVIVDMVRQAGNIRINVGSGGWTSINTSGKTVFSARSVSGNDVVISIPATFSGHIKSIEVKGIVVIGYNYLNLPEYVSKGPQQQLRYIYDATGRKISQEVYDEGGLIAKKSDYGVEFFYENDTLRFISHEEGRVVMEGGAPEYQYHLKDHLGNVRLTFTTKDEVETDVATLETESNDDERTAFLHYDEAVVVNHELFDHTSDGGVNETYKATRLIGGDTDEKIGLVRSLSVMPGDEISMEVWSKYLDPDPENWEGAFEAFLTLYASGGAPAGTIVDGGFPGSLGNEVFSYATLLNRQNVVETAPKAYLTWLVFDRDFNPLIEECGFVQIGATGTLPRENGTNVAHERLRRETPLKINQAGYVYIYISNENETPVEVYFDDFKVEHVKSPVVQMDDYYPFGLTYNSYQRENSLPNQYQYNGKELQNELNLGWLDYGARMYDPAIGRWMAIDQLAYKYHAISPYNYVNNNPALLIDPDGNEIIVGNSTSATITKLAQIAATSDGNKKLQKLVRSNNKYYTESVFWTTSSAYDGRGDIGRARTIYFVGSAWRSTVDKGANSSVYVLGHEMNHAYDHEMTGSSGESDRKGRETNAVRFGNYLMSVYGEEKMRTQYSGLGLKFPSDPSRYNTKDEKVANFKTEFENQVGGITAMGFSYTKSPEGEKETTMYHIGLVNEDGKYLYAIYSNKDDYDAAVKRVQAYQSKKKENEEK